MPVQGQTNVSSLRSGRGSVHQLGNKLGRFVVTTMEIPWSVTKDKLGARPEKVIMIETMEESWLDQMLSTLPECDTVVGIGGGQAIDDLRF